MNFTYTLKIPNKYVTHDIRYKTYNDSNIIRINTSSTEYNTMENIMIYFNDDSIENTTKNTINQPGILIKTGENLEITYYSYSYGDISKINVLYSSYFIPYLEDIRLFVNYKSLPFINIYSYNNQNETVETIFKTNANIVQKNQTLTFTPRYAVGCDEYDLLQTYILTNEIITPQILNQTIKEIENDINYSEPFLIVPQYRTVLEAMNTIMMIHTYGDYISKKLNSSLLLLEEGFCMAGIENNRMNYIHYNNPLMSTSIMENNNEKNILFNMFLSMYSYQFAKFSLNTIKYNCSTTSIDEIIRFTPVNSWIYYLYDNITKKITVHSFKTENISIILNLENGIIISIINLNNFEYIGAVTEEITIKTSKLMANRNKLASICYEYPLFINYSDKSKNLLNYTIDSPETVIEDFIGGLVFDAGIAVFGGTIVGGLGAIGIGSVIIAAGMLIMADANGVTTDITNISRIFNTGISIGLSFYMPAKISKYTVSAYKLSKPAKIFEQGGTIEYVVEVLMKGFHEVKKELMDFVQSQYIVKKQENTFYHILMELKG